MRTKPLSAKETLKALASEGVRVAQPYADWSTRSRDRSTGRSFGPVQGVVIHHTAGSKSQSLVYRGRPGLPGPLAHAYLAKSGVVSVISIGRANHAGRFSANAHRSVTGARSGGFLVRLAKRIVGKSHQIPTNLLVTPPRPSRSEEIDANDAYYGIEIENLGNGRDPYPMIQYDAAVRYAAALCRAHGWTAQRVIGHKEGTRRKIDPHGPIGSPQGDLWSMNRFRVDVQNRLNRSEKPVVRPTPSPAPKKAPPKPAANRPVAVKSKSREPAAVVRAQAATALSRWPFITAVERHYGLPTGLLLAVGSRETGLRNIVGDRGHGFGVWQRDNRWWKVNSKYLKDVQVQAEDAAKLLAANRKSLGSWSHAISAYNAGVGGVKKALKARKSADSVTTGGDYAADVLGRLEHIRGPLRATSPAPKKATPKKPVVGDLSRRVKPGARHPQVVVLQRLLIEAGYGPIKGYPSESYGPNTRAAVARFHDDNPRFKSRRNRREVQIGPLGWAFLKKKAGY